FNDPRLHSLRRRLDQIGLPWVMINPPDAQSIHNYVAADNRLNCQLVGECLARLGCRRVMALMAGGVHASETEREKFTGLVHGFLEVDAPLAGVEYLVCGGITAAAAHQAISAALKQRPAPEAVFAMADEMASGVIAAC